MHDPDRPRSNRPQDSEAGGEGPGNVPGHSKRPSRRSPAGGLRSAGHPQPFLPEQCAGTGRSSPDNGSRIVRQGKTSCAAAARTCLPRVRAATGQERQRAEERLNPPSPTPGIVYAAAMARRAEARAWETMLQLAPADAQARPGPMAQGDDEGDPLQRTAAGKGAAAPAAAVRGPENGPPVGEEAASPRPANQDRARHRAERAKALAAAPVDPPGRRGSAEVREAAAQPQVPGEPAQAPAAHDGPEVCKPTAAGREPRADQRAAPVASKVPKAPASAGGSESAASQAPAASSRNGSADARPPAEDRRKGTVPGSTADKRGRAY
jgi:hypothetical protein